MARITKADEAFLRRIAGPEHWSKRDARRVLALREATGESEAGFARRYGLRGRRLGWWRRRLDEWTPEEPARDYPQDGDAEVGQSFVELVMRDEPEPTAATVRVGDVVIELAAVDRAGAEFVAAVSRALEAEPCC